MFLLITDCFHFKVNSIKCTKNENIKEGGREGRKRKEGKGGKNEWKGREKRREGKKEKEEKPKPTGSESSGKAAGSKLFQEFLIRFYNLEVEFRRL